MTEQKKPALLPQPAQDPRSDAVFAERLSYFMGGKVTPPNPYCAHIIEKLKAIDAEGNQQAQIRNQAQADLSRSTTRIVELNAQAKSYVEDLRKFDKELHDDSNKEKAQ